MISCAPSARIVAALFAVSGTTTTNCARCLGDPREPDRCLAITAGRAQQEVKILRPIEVVGQLREQRHALGDDLVDHDDQVALEGPLILTDQVLAEVPIFVLSAVEGVYEAGAGDVLTPGGGEPVGMWVPVDPASAS